MSGKLTVGRKRKTTARETSAVCRETKDGVEAQMWKEADKMRVGQAFQQKVL